MKKPRKNVAPVARRLLSYARAHTGKLLAILIFAAIGSTATLAAPTYIGRAVDAMPEAGKVDFSAILKVLPVLGGLYLVSGVLLWLGAVLASRTATGTVAALRKDAFGKMTALPLKSIDGRPHGDLVSRISNDADAVTEGLTQFFTQFFTGIVTVLAALFFMLRMNALVTLAVVIATPLIFIVGKTVSRYSSRSFKEQQKVLGELNGYVDEHFRGLRTVQAFHYEDRALEGFEEINARLYDVGQKAQFYSSLTNPSTRFVNSIAYLLVGIVGGLSAVYAGFSVGSLASFLTYCALFSRPFNEFTAITTQLMSAMAAAERLFALIDEPAEPADSVSAGELNHVRGAVEFSHVDFSYRPEQPLIRDFNLKVKPGSAVAIVGPTGAGKTTMVNLLMRFYDLTGGEIRIDGEDIAGVKRDSLRRSFGMVLQETWLFKGTIAENISYGNPGVSREEIVEAAKAASAHGFIRRLPEGYDTVIDEGGGNISQGQKQLITIARAMLLNPPMLILDEATSSVDTLTEQKIQKTFLKMMKGHTSFVIAHRLSTIREADLILVMDKGQVVEQGTHRELLERGGFYAGLYNSQFEAAGKT